ncbi:MAG TPA: hypothetical protein VMD58_03370 [Acidobacteriaceae bacterium]|nr:hypothetical protein [Acidobacteriaceae bacterium]
MVEKKGAGQGSDLLKEIYMRNYQPRTLINPFLNEGLPFPIQGITV